MSSDTSRDQPSDVLKATTRTGFSYSPLSMLRIKVSLSASFSELTIRPTDAAKVVENEIDLDIEPRNVGDEPRTTHDTTH
jgi:hypothetical protein